MNSDSSIRWVSHGRTDPGKSRSLNEDALLEKPEKGMWVVADGMGGHDRGDYASSLLTRLLSESPISDNLELSVEEVVQKLKSINSSLVREAREKRSSMIGCTVVVLLVTRSGDFACIWAGDSRLYKLSDGVLEQISIDHSEVQELVNQGILNQIEAENHPSANIINRAIGAEEKINLDVSYGKLNPGDKCLLCSDGLYRELFEGEIGQLLQEQDDSEKQVEQLVNLALERGARDNVTAITVSIQARNP